MCAGRFTIASLLFAAVCALAAEPTATARTTDGVTIAYEARGQSDTALVFIHGWCCNRAFWKEQLGEFAKDYRAVALDLGGHGTSGATRDRWTIAGLAADVEAVVKALDLKRVILVGHSMGGSISLIAAKQMPGTVIGVVGVDTLHNAEFEFPKELAAQITERYKTDFAKTMREFIPQMLPADTKKELIEWIVTQANGTHRGAAVGLMGDFQNVDLKAALTAAKVPVRCINATPKLQFSMPTAAEINKKYADFAVVEMDGVGHYPMLERPAEFNDKLRATVREILAARK